MSFREHCEVFDWGIVMEENRKVIAATGINEGVAPELTLKKLYQMENILNPQKMKKSFYGLCKSLISIPVLIFVGIACYKAGGTILLLKIIDVYIGGLLIMLGISCFIIWEGIKVLNKELKKEFYDEISGDEEYLIITGKEVIRKITFAEDIAIFEYGNLVIIRRKREKGIAEYLYMAEIRDLESFYKLVEGKVDCYRM